MQDISGFFAYDDLTFEPLRQRGWAVTMVAWNDPNIDWGRYEAVVIRSPWDYHQTPGEFFRVLSEIDASPAKLLNPLEVCRWNLNKAYLRDLDQRGVPIIPTIWLERLQVSDLPQLFHDFQGRKIVVKPTIGAGSIDTFVLTSDDSQYWQPALDAFIQQPLMIQPFVEAIIDEGEYSLFYFGGEFSHAILKSPKPDDFRVQEEHGGIIRSITVDEPLATAGQRALDAIGQRLLYARVDLVQFNNRPALMELELIEPSLYFPYDEPSPARFAEAFVQMMG
jgi:glutathione synthase/RimK-type ligase-like ATP-grasp enzyme